MSAARASRLIGRPVVTLESGDIVGSVKDVVLSARSGRLRALMLECGGSLSKVERKKLPLSAVRALGPDAVMIDRADVLLDADAKASDSDIIAIDAVSESGGRIGSVRDVILDTDQGAAVIGYEIEAVGGGKLLIREEDAISFSEDALVVAPGAEAVEWNELGGFGPALPPRSET